MVKGTDTLEGDQSLWTATTVRLPSLMYVDYVWGEREKDEWLRMPHCHRLDLLNARAGALDLDCLTMPLTLNFEVDNYDNVRIYEGFAPINLTYNSSGYTYLGFTADMSTHMQSADAGALGTFWQAPKDVLTQFMMASGPVVVTRLRSMYRETRPETLFFFSTLIKEAIKGHNEWVSNGGYTIEGDRDLGPSLAREYEEAVRAQNRPTQAVSRLVELRSITSQWEVSKQASLQQYLDAADRGDVADLSRFMVFDEGWSRLTQEEQDIAIELWTQEDRDYNSSGESGNDDDGNGGGSGGGDVDDDTDDVLHEISDLGTALPSAQECTESGSNVQCDNPTCTAHA